MKQTMHIVLKYNDKVYSIDTISMHMEHLNQNGKVIWGIIKPKVDSPGISKDKISLIKNQIANGKDTYAYFANGGHIKAKGKITVCKTSVIAPAEPIGCASLTSKW